MHSLDKIEMTVAKLEQRLFLSHCNISVSTKLPWLVRRSNAQRSANHFAPEAKEEKLVYLRRSQALKSEGWFASRAGQRSTRHPRQRGSTSFHGKRRTSAPRDAVGVRPRSPRGCSSHPPASGRESCKGSTPNAANVFGRSANISPPERQDWEGKGCRGPRSALAEGASGIRSLICELFNPQYTLTSAEVTYRTEELLEK